MNPVRVSRLRSRTATAPATWGGTPVQVTALLLTQAQPSAATPPNSTTGGARNPVPHSLKPPEPCSGPLPATGLAGQEQPAPVKHQEGTTGGGVTALGRGKSPVPEGPGGYCTGQP